MIDNYDSFTYNLVQYLGELGERIVVVRNNRNSVQKIEEMQPHRIVISPGPGTPDDAGISLATVEHLAGKIPILGICLGHQCIGQVFGGRVVRAGRLVHGKTSIIHHNRKGVFENIPSPFPATRYHSLLLERETLPDCLEITAETEEGEIMGIRHRTIPALEGVQFHPESILTEYGMELLRNFLQYGAVERRKTVAAD